MLRREAATWLARLQGGRDPDVERKFKQWYDADPRHAAAFDRVRRSYEQAGLLRHAAMAGSAQPDVAIRRPGWKPLPALAAAAAVIVLVPAGMILFRGGSILPASTEAVMLMTSVGEIRQVSLADGSKVTLDTATKVEVEIGRSHRGAHLRYGRARFQIAQGSEPFVLQTAKTTVTASQAVIDVEEGERQDRVQVLAGAADVRGPDQNASSVALAPGDTVTMNSGGTGQKSVAALDRDWTRGMLQFEATPLADALAAANRYSKQHIIIDENLRGLRVSGAFHAGDTYGLAKALATAFHLSLRATPDGNLFLSRKPASEQQE
jgi:transmembrane sensor